MDILLVNIHSFCNAGDAALTQVALQQLLENFPESHITLMMNDPHSHTGEEKVIGSFLQWVRQMDKQRGIKFLWVALNSLLPIMTFRLFRKPIFGLMPKELRATLCAYFDAEIVVSNPGGYYHSAGKGLGLLIFFYTMVIAVLSGKPLYLFPQSFGPFRHQRECVLTRWLFKKARLVLVREHISTEHLANCRIPKEHYRVIPDMAFAFEGVPFTKALDWYHANEIDLHSDRPLLGMTIIDWAAQSGEFQFQEEYEQTLVAASRHFIENYMGKVLIFPQCWGPDQEEDDRLPGKRVAEHLTEYRDSVLAISSPLSPGLLKSVYGQMDMLIGTRMHSNIFAISQGVPVIAIGYRHKTAGISKYVGIERWVIDISKLEGNILVNKLDELWQEKSAVREMLNSKVPELIDQARQAGSLLAADYASFIKEKIDG